MTASASASAFDTTPFQSHYVAPEPEPFLSEPLMAEPVMQAEIEPDRGTGLARASHGRGTGTHRTEVPFIEAAPFIDVPRPARVAPRSIEIDEIDRLARELGLNLKYVETAAERGVADRSLPVDEGDMFDFGAALDRARNERRDPALGRNGAARPRCRSDSRGRHRRGARRRRTRGARSGRCRPGTRAGRGRSDARGGDCRIPRG